MTRFISIPTEIEAIQFTGHASNVSDILAWANLGSPEGEANVIDNRYAGMHFLTIWTSEGVMNANIGDWIIRGTEGEYYPCKPEVFAKKYRPIDGQKEETPQEKTG